MVGDTFVDVSLLVFLPGALITQEHNPGECQSVHHKIKTFFSKITKRFGLLQDAICNYFHALKHQGVYSDMYMTGGLGPAISWDTPKNKYQETSDPKK